MTIEQNRPAMRSIEANPQRFYRPLLIVLLMLVTMLVYWPGLRGGFIFDDFPVLVDNTRVHLNSLSLSELADAAFSFSAGGGTRPLAMATFALNHFFGELNPWGYKIAGLGIHLLNTCFVWLLCHQLLTLSSVRSTTRAYSAVALALVWSTHPLQASTVLYVVQRMEILSLTFTLLALICYIAGRRRQIEGRSGALWLAACVPLVVLGLASKETAALLPAYTLALELTLLQFRGADGDAERRIKLAYGAAVAIGILAFVILVVPAYTSPAAYSTRDFSATERLLSQPRVLAMYLAQITLPVQSLMPFYYDDLRPSISLANPISTLFSAGLLTSLAAAGWLSRRKLPLLSLGILWFFAAHAITSNVAPLELAFEHRNYFALLGVLLALAELIRRIPAGQDARAKYLAVTCVVVGVAGLGAIRSATWGDKLLLATELVAINPQSARAAHGLATIYYEMSDGSRDSPFFSLALQQFERESNLPGTSIMGEHAMILLEPNTEHQNQTRHWDSLIEKLKTGPITPETTQAVFALLENRYRGLELDDQRLAEAMTVLLSRATFPAHSYAQFGDYVLEYLEDESLANSAYARAVELSVDDASFISHMALALIEQGRQAQADLVLELAQAQDAHFMLATKVEGS